MSDSDITLIGNVTREPSLRFTAGGQGVASFGLAVNQRWQKNGEWQEKVSFFNVSAWGSLGENAAASLQKGNRVIVKGRLEEQEYENREGQKIRSVQVVADEIGAALRWAKVEIEKITRETNTSSGSSSSGGGGSRQSTDPVYGDEEPF